MNDRAVMLRTKVCFYEIWGGACMAIVFPSEAIARRWDGALQARLRRVPLEEFLKRRGIDPAPAGVSQDSDNLVRATVVIVEAGVTLYCSDRPKEFGFLQQRTVGHVACLVTRALTELIAQPPAWRIAALLSAARLLTPWVGLNAAAMASASAARRFEQEEPEAASSVDLRVFHHASAAVSNDSAEAMERVSLSIAARLSPEKHTT